MKDCTSFLCDYLESLGFSFKADEFFNVTAERVFDGEKLFLMNTHFDTVAPSNQWREALNPKLRANTLQKMVPDG